jgi:hypothetical protein
MLVTVSSHIDPTDAHIMRCRLEAEGVPAFVAHEHHVRLTWHLATALGGAKVQVAEEDAETAKQIIEAVARGDYALPDEPDDSRHCPKCRSVYVIPDKNTWRISLLSAFLLSLPLPFTKQRMRCLACGYAGKQHEF